MVRVTFEILPGGSEERKRIIGVMELALLKVHPDGCGDYAVVLKKTPPYAGALRAAWRKGAVLGDDATVDRVVAGEDEEMLAALAAGHHRTKRGVYDLCFRALRACGLAERNPSRA